MFVCADLQQRDPDTFKPLHIVSMTIRDSAEDSAAAAGDVLELCKMVNKWAEWLLLSFWRDHSCRCSIARRSVTSLGGKLTLAGYTGSKRGGSIGSGVSVDNVDRADCSICTNTHGVNLEGAEHERTSPQQQTQERTTKYPHGYVPLFLDLSWCIPACRYHGWMDKKIE